MKHIHKMVGGMVASSLLLSEPLTQKSAVSVFKVLKGVILSEIDSRNGPIKLAYFITLCSKYIYTYRISSNLYTPDSVSLASLTN